MNDTVSAAEFPASFAQQRLWFLEQLEELGAAYTVRLPVRLRGVLDVGALERAIAALVARHEALRTTLHASGGEAVQRIAPQLSVPLEQVTVAPDALRACATDTGRHRFDLARGPLVRFVLLRAAADDHVLMVLMHHVIGDAWSSGVLFRDLAALYTAGVAGEPAMLPPLAVQYADYAVWQREWLTGVALGRQADYWRSVLDGAPPQLELPTDWPRPPVQSWRGSRWTRILPRELTAAIDAAARAEGCTTFVLLITVYAILLQRYAGVADVVIGTPVANRRRTELENVVGFFANTLPLRADFSAAPTFRAALAEMRQHAIAAWDHQDLPFEKLVEALNPERSLSHSPVFQVLFTLQNTPWEAATMAGLAVEPADCDAPDAARFDLSLSATEYEGELWLAFEYGTALFRPATIETFAARYEALLRAALLDPASPINTLPIEDAATIAATAVLHGPALPVDPSQTVHALVAAAALRTPAAVAIECGERRWTYAELGQYAATLAARLNLAGVGPGSVLGLCIERSPEMVGALLGILQAGATYLPLDPGFPPARLAFMLEDSGCTALLTTRALAGCRGAWTGRVLELDDLQPVDCAIAPVHTAAVSGAADAYLIYTSGSTGTPKGVRISHASVVNFLASMQREPGIGATDRWLAVTTLSFDIAVLELLGPLVSGATVVIADTEAARDGQALRRLLESERITVMQATPARWRALIDAGWNGTSDLRVLCGGEVLDGELAAALLARGAALWNLYGPTETTVWSTCARITDPRAISIGAPIDNTILVCIDEQRQVLPQGLTGELCIGGAGLAVGYWRRPELDAERFIDSDGVGRLYRTGDRARLGSDGGVALFGRSDAQVKLRGFRVELGEIEAALVRLPGVLAAAAGLQMRGAGDARLVAWCVLREGAEAQAARWRSALATMLPDYMLPAAFVAVAALPLTPNGKLDRRALPEPDWQFLGLELARDHTAPRDGTEALLAELFGDVLGQSAPVGVHADFFALGGHSLLALRLLARLRQTCGVEVELRRFFAAPTVAGLRAALPAAAVAVAPVLRTSVDSVPLSWQQERLWFLDQLEPGNSAYHLHMAYRLEGELRIDALKGSLQSVVARHEALRTCFPASDGVAAQQTLPELEIQLEIFDRRLATSKAVAAELTEFAVRPFDLRQGPVLRAALIRSASDAWLFVLVVHHIVAGGWSLAVLLRELQADYNARCSGETHAFAPLPLRYADYAAWQRSAAARIAADLDWWRDALDGAPTILPLPADRVRPVVRRNAGARLHVELPEAARLALAAHARGADATLFMALLAGFDALLARWSGAEDVLVGVPVAGRSRAEFEPLIGYFVNTLVLRIDLHGNPRFDELVARAREATLDALAHAEVPFEQLVDALNPPRDTGRTPLVQVLFNLHNEPEQSLELAGLRATRASIERRTAKFDLSVSVLEHARGLGITFEYNTDLYEADTVRAMAEGYVALLGAVAADFGQRLGALPVAGADWLAARVAERARVGPPPVAADALVATPRDGTLVSRIATQVAARAAALAVCDGTQSWSYQELWSRAGAVANAVTHAGTSAGAPVALLLGHDALMVAGLLGVLRGGRAYLPLDPYAPEARQRELLANAACEVVVTDVAHRAAASWLESLPVATVIVIESVERDDLQPADLNVEVGNDTPAYRLFTSGTTGFPKAVEQTHHGVLGHVGAWSRQLGIGPADRLALFAGYGTDAAVQDLFGALLNGASVHPLDLRGGASGPELVDRVAAEGITLLHFTPTVYRHLFGGRVTCDQDLSRVRLVVLGGEEARRSDFELFRLRFQRGARFVNGLGLTESTTALQWFADHDSRVLGDRLPVGVPVPGTDAAVVDEASLSSAWQGELVLASGWLGRIPGATAAPARHRSGDRLRLLPDGQWLHAGRGDRQVKLRGVRIEPGEIEVALRGVAGVGDAHVALSAGDDAEPALVAWVAAGAGTAEVDLRRALRSRLPENLIPARFVVLPELPRRPGGKLDAQALDESWQSLHRAPVAVATAGKEAVPADQDTLGRLTAIWAGVLGRETIGPHEDFFASGGHSLLATRLIARVRDAFAVELPLLSLFEAPTVSGMAAAIGRARQYAVPAELPALRRLSRQVAP